MPSFRTTLLKFLIIALGIFCSSVALAGDVKPGLAYVPADHQVLVTADVDGLKASPIFDLAFAALAPALDGEEYKTLVKATGFEPKKHLHSIVGFNSNAAPKEFLLIAEVDIDAEKLVTWAKAHSETMREVSLGGQKYYRLENDGALMLTGSRLLLGHESMLKKALAAKAGKGRSKAALVGRIAQLATKGQVTLGLTLSQDMRSKLERELPAAGQIRSALFTLQASSQLKLSAELAFDTSSAATQLAELAKAIVSSPSPGQPAEFRAILSRMSFSTEGKTMHLSTRATRSEVKAILAQLP